MTDKLRQAAEMALEALEDVQDMMTTSDWFNDRVQAVRQALDQLPDTTKMIDTGIDRGAWSDVPDATKWVEEQQRMAKRIAELETAAKQGLKAFEVATTHFARDRQEVLAAMSALRQALDDTGTDRGAWDDVHDATKWVDELRGGDEEWTPDDMAYRPNGLSLEESPTDAQIIAGAIFDFAGFLTTRDKVIKVGSTANTAHVADLVKEWADMRKLSLDDAAVSWWQDVLEESPNSTTDFVEPEPFGWLFKQADGDLYKLLRGEDAKWHEKNNPSWIKVSPLYTAPPKREWQWLTYSELQEIMDSMKTWNSFDITDIYVAVEAKLKEKNNG